MSLCDKMHRYLRRYPVESKGWKIEGTISWTAGCPKASIRIRDGALWRSFYSFTLALPDVEFP